MSGSHWTGSIVSIDCGEVIGVYEGKISKVDETNQTIYLINPLRNSVKFQRHEVAINIKEIKSLTILESTLKKHLKDTDKSSTTGGQLMKNGYVRNSPIAEESQKKKNSNDPSKKKGAKRSNSKKRQKDYNEECFSAPVDNAVMNIDFDFEKNLALFDKQAIFDEINAQNKSDHVKLVDCNKRAPVNYRPDENVLNCEIPILKQISIPCSSMKEFVTDSGLVVPSVTVDFKKVLYEKGEELGYTPRIRTEMIGRAACEMVLHLVGGSHRLNPQNNHQRPSVVVLCGSHLQGAQGVSCGRHLANHCVNITILSAPQDKDTYSLVANEMRLFALSCGKMVTSVSSLPSSVDLIVDALESHTEPKPEIKSWLSHIRQWVQQCRAPVLCLDPSPNCNSLEPKFILAPALPFAFQNEKCSIHICDIGLPDGVFKRTGCTYSSPFGSKFVIPLYYRSPSS